MGPFCELVWRCRCCDAARYFFHCEVGRESSLRGGEGSFIKGVYPGGKGFVVVRRRESCCCEAASESLL